GPDPRNFNQRVSLGRNDLLIRTFLSSAHTKRVVKKANDYPAIIAAFSTEVCCFFLFYCLDDEKPGN
ncbi:hypothetical protein QU760_21975, partial [Escherichia coli]|nr:hypothetical protein [Escherichia coli]